MKVDGKTIGFANRLADAAGAAILPWFRNRVEITDKGGTRFDPVTEADKAAETAMREMIARDRPDDGILGEEFGEKPGTSGERWVLDPIDGTRAFISGRHEWGTLIGLERDGVAHLGIIDQPVLGERFLGANGKTELQVVGVTSQINIRGCPSISDAILCATDPSSYFSAGEQAAFARVSRKAKLTRYGGDCYLFAMLALGFIDVIIESGFHRWDAAAVIPIVEGAGGVITNWQGGSCSDGGQILAIGDPHLHEQVIKLLAG